MVETHLQKWHKNLSLVKMPRKKLVVKRIVLQSLLRQLTEGQYRVTKMGSSPVFLGGATERAPVALWD